MKLNTLKPIALSIFMLTVLNVGAQSKLDRQTLMTIGDKAVTVKEFTEVYEKNNLNNTVVEKKSVDEYLNLYTGYRMKVMEAQAMQLDTSAKFKRELDGYRKQLAKPYFSNDKVSDALLHEAYDRLQHDVRASHILIACDKHALPSDTLKAYNKALDLRKRALKGEDFGALAMQYSDDPSARDIKGEEGRPGRKGNRGDLGYFTVFDMVYPFESGAYKTKPGEISMPVRSDFGYHIIKVASITKAIGSTQAAHVFLKLEAEATPEEEAAMRDKADNIYKELMAQDGKNWIESVNKYSDDRGTVSRGGTLSNFTVSRIVPEFIEAIKGVEPGHIAKPVRSMYGFHIIKLISTSEIGSFEKESYGLTQRLEKDMRSKKSEEVVLRQLRKDYKFKQNDKNMEAFMATIDSTILSGSFVPAANVAMDALLFNIEKKSFKVGDFVEYIKKNQKPQKFVTSSTYAYQLYEEYSNKQLMDYADQHLEERYPEFAHVVKEYYDGILLFDLMEREVWRKAIQDTVGLQAFYDRTGSKYVWGDRVYAAVISTTNSESLAKMKAVLAQGVAVDSLRSVISRDSIPQINMRKGFFQKGDNQFVDQTEWKKGAVKEIPSTVDKTTVLVVVEDVRGPEQKTLNEAKGLVTSDYQAELEQQWMERMRQKYPVKINQSVLEKVRKCY